MYEKRKSALKDVMWSQQIARPLFCLWVYLLWEMKELVLNKRQGIWWFIFVFVQDCVFSWNISKVREEWLTGYVVGVSNRILNMFNENSLCGPCVDQWRAVSLPCSSGPRSEQRGPELRLHARLLGLTEDEAFLDTWYHRRVLCTPHMNFLLYFP